MIPMMPKTMPPQAPLTTQRISIWIFKEFNSLILWHKITLDESACRYNQSINPSTLGFCSFSPRFPSWFSSTNFVLNKVHRYLWTLINCCAYRSGPTWTGCSFSFSWRLDCWLPKPECYTGWTQRKTVGVGKRYWPTSVKIAVDVLLPSLSRFGVTWCKMKGFLDQLKRYREQERRKIKEVFMVDIKWEEIDGKVTMERKRRKEERVSKAKREDKNKTDENMAR